MQIRHSEENCGLELRPGDISMFMVKATSLVDYIQHPDRLRRKKMEIVKLHLKCGG